MRGDQSFKSQSCRSIKSKMPFHKTVNKQQSLQEAKQLNMKLHKLFETLKANFQMKRQSTADNNTSQPTKYQLGSEEANIMHLKKQAHLLEAQAQHKTYLLNLLISENQKLKSQVNNSRNSRVIYSSVYKNLEKDTRKWEEIFKVFIIENMAAEAALDKLTEKYHKMKHKLNKCISTLQEQVSVDQEEKEVENVDMDNSQMKDMSNLKEERKAYQKKNWSDNQPDEQEELFEYERKKTYYDYAVKRIHEITQLDNMDEIVELKNSIKQQTEQQFEEYLQLDKALKDKEEEINEVKRSLQMHNQREMLIKGTIKFLPEARDVTQEIEKEEARKIQLQKELKQMIDMNCEDLTQAEILHFLKEKPTQTQSLERALENCKKEKPIDSYLVSPKQMHQLNLKPS